MGLELLTSMEMRRTNLATWRLHETGKAKGATFARNPLNSVVANP